MRRARRLCPDRSRPRLQPRRRSSRALRALPRPPRAGARVLAIGPGAGLPGLPLKLAWPSLRLSLVESNAKKCAFLREVVRELALTGVEVLEGRAADFGRDATHREAFDLAVARAVAPLPVLLAHALPLLRVGGHLA